MSKMKEREAKKALKIIKDCRKLPGNRKCMDCTERGPQYICLDFGTFVCTNCSGLHRELNHTVKGISVSTFTKENAEKIERTGNDVARSIWLATYDPVDFREPDSHETERVREFIRLKYQVRRWVRHSSPKKTKRKSHTGSKHKKKHIVVVESSESEEESEEESDEETSSETESDSTTHKPLPAIPAFSSNSSRKHKGNKAGTHKPKADKIKHKNDGSDLFDLDAMLGGVEISTSSKKNEIQDSNGWANFDSAPTHTQASQSQKQPEPSEWADFGSTIPSQGSTSSQQQPTQWPLAFGVEPQASITEEKQQQPPEWADFASASEPHNQTSTSPQKEQKRIITEDVFADLIQESAPTTTFGGNSEVANTTAPPFQNQVSNPFDSSPFHAGGYIPHPQSQTVPVFQQQPPNQYYQMQHQVGYPQQFIPPQHQSQQPQVFSDPNPQGQQQSQTADFNPFL